MSILTSVFGFKAMAITGAVALAIGAAGGFGAGMRMQDGKVQRAQATAADWKRAAQDWKTNRDGWKASQELSEKRRGEERQDALKAVNDGAAACNARVAQVRASDRAMWKMLAKPVKLDGNGCPVRTLFDPKAILQPGVR